MEVGKIADIEGSKPWQDEKEFYEEYKDKVIIKHLYGPLFFGFTSYFKDQIKALPEDVEAVILRMDRVPYVDQSGLYTLEEIIFDLRAQNTEVVIVGLNEQPRDMMVAIDIIPDLMPENDLFENIEDSFGYLKDQFKADKASG